MVVPPLGVLAALHPRALEQGADLVGQRGVAVGGILELIGLWGESIVVVDEFRLGAAGYCGYRLLLVGWDGRQAERCQRGALDDGAMAGRR